MQRTTDFLIIPKFRMNADVLPDKELHVLYSLPLIIKGDQIKKETVGKSCAMN